MNQYRWASRGDINAFFGLMLDNTTVLVLLVAIVAGKDQFDAGFIVRHMIPGTALGVLVGDLIYTWLAFRLAKRTGRSDVTAMPLGLDTPSTFAVGFLVLLPAMGEWLKDHSGDNDNAMLFAWHVGQVVLICIGIFKTLLAPFGNAIRSWIPRAGLLGSLAAIAIALIAFLPLVQHIFTMPVVGMAALIIVLVALVARRPLFGHFPGALAAVLVGILVYYVSRWFGGDLAVPALPTVKESGAAQLFAWPEGMIESGYFGHVVASALAKLPLMMPFALATIVGGIDCTESAAAVGDEYDTRSILMTEGVASIVAGMLGGVIQNTPYIGHPAYKAMGGRAAYTLATALFIGVVGCFGVMGHVFAWLPDPALFPLLVFVGVELTAQSFHATPTKHYPALALACLPTLALLGMILVKTALGTQPVSPLGAANIQALTCLSNGFILTSLIWGSALALILDNRLFKAAGFLAVAGLFSLFGIIHSPFRDEEIALPWTVIDRLPTLHDSAKYQTPYHWAAAYGLAALLLIAMAAWGIEVQQKAEQEAEEDPNQPS